MQQLNEWLDSFFADMLAQRVEAIIGHYADRADLYVHLEGPRWSNMGHERIAKGWRDFFGSGLGVESIQWAEGPVVHGSDDMASIAGIMDVHTRTPEGVKLNRFRGTWVLNREGDGRWRIVHEHFSQPVADPYGIGDWLKPA